MSSAALGFDHFDGGTNDCSAAFINDLTAYAGVSDRLGAGREGMKTRGKKENGEQKPDRDSAQAGTPKF
jgi:hypothetical protein